MPLFGPKFAPGTEGPSISNPRSVSGRPVSPLETPGSVARRGRMFGEAMRIAEAGSDLAIAIPELFEREQSLAKWVSLRGGLAFVAIALEDPEISLDRLAEFAGHGMPAGANELVHIYPQLERASFSDILDDQNLCRNRDFHYALIAWCAAAFVGGGLQRRVDIPPPQALSEPGWYTEPVFTKCERYWDGADWTSKCRSLEGRRWELLHLPF